MNIVNLVKHHFLSLTFSLVEMFFIMDALCYQYDSDITLNMNKCKINRNEHFIKM